MDRLKLRRSNAPVPLNIRNESDQHPTHLHDRPLSLIDDQVPRDTLEALLDFVPSRSLPATPLAKKRLDVMQFSPPESPMFTGPESPGPESLMFTGPESPGPESPGPGSPGTESPGTESPGPESHGPESSGPESLLSSPELPTNSVTMPVGVPGEDLGDVTVAMSEPVGSHMPTVEHTPSEEIKIFQERNFIWDKIHEVLEESDKVTSASDMSYDSLPIQDQDWLNHSSGLEQLRAFLAVCD